MRTKRVQRRRARVPAKPTVRTGLPDLFSRDNADLVHDEVEREYMCPCCVERLLEIQLNREEQLYVGDLMPLTYESELGTRYAPLVERLSREGEKHGYYVCPPNPICCPRCWAENVLDDYEFADWQRAFPDLAWNDEWWPGK